MDPLIPSSPRNLLPNIRTFVIVLWTVRCNLGDTILVVLMEHKFKLCYKEVQS